MAKIGDQEINECGAVTRHVTKNSGMATGPPHFLVTKPMPVELSGHMVCSKVFTCMREYFLTSLPICALLALDYLTNVNPSPSGILAAVYTSPVRSNPPISLFTTFLSLPSYGPKLLSGLECGRASLPMKTFPSLLTPCEQVSSPIRLPLALFSPTPRCV